MFIEQISVGKDHKFLELLNYAQKLSGIFGNAPAHLIPEILRDFTLIVQTRDKEFVADLREVPQN